MSYLLKYKRFGKNSILIEWPNNIDEMILQSIIEYKSLIEKNIKNKSIINSYNSLLVSFNSLNNFQKTIDELKALYSKKKISEKLKFYRWYIPVCYENEFGSDLQDLEKKYNLDQEKIIKIHTAFNYKLYNIGFIPGFMYLGGLNKKIHFPRKRTPILDVKKGSVGIGGSHTGIYPHNSPGGWNIIGNSPVNLFNPNANPPCFIKPGDEVRFFTISKKDHKKIKSKVESNNYKLVKKLIND